MKSNCFLYFILFCGLLLFSPQGRAQELSTAEAEAFALKQGENLLKAFGEQDISTKYKELDSLFVKYIDLNYISKFVVGKYWREMTSTQQQKYQSLFKRYAMSLYKGFPLQFEDRISFTISGSRHDGNDVIVNADINYRKPEGGTDIFPVEFRMHKINGNIMLTDIKVADSSLILSYRTRFYQMIKESDEDMEWFLEDFELTTKSAEKHYALPIEK